MGGPYFPSVPTSYTSHCAGVLLGRLGQGACVWWGRQLFRPAVSGLALCGWPIKFPPRPYQACLA